MDFVAGRAVRLGSQAVRRTTEGSQTLRPPRNKVPGSKGLSAFGGVEGQRPRLASFPRLPPKRTP